MNYFTKLSKILEICKCFYSYTNVIDKINIRIKYIYLTNNGSMCYFCIVNEQKKTKNINSKK